MSNGRKFEHPEPRTPGPDRRSADAVIAVLVVIVVLALAGLVGLLGYTGWVR